MPVAGVLLCLVSAAAFGAMGIFGTLAYDEGVTVGTLLAVRFAVAAALFWAWLAATGALHRLRAVTTRDLALAVGLGALGYSAQSGAYFAALQRMDAGLLALILYTFPALVTVAAIRLGRATFDGRTAGALVLSTAGLALVVAGAGAGALDPAGAVLGLVAAAVYATYILTSEGVARRLGPLVLSTLVCTGAAGTLGLGGSLVGVVDPGGVTLAGWGWLVAIAVVSTVGAVSLFFAGLDRVGPTAAAILSTFEPFVTVVLATLVFGASLGPVQLVGGAMIVAGVVVLNLRRQRPRRAPRRRRSPGSGSTRRRASGSGRAGRRERAAPG